MHVGLVLIERQRSLHFIQYRAHAGVAVFAPIIHPGLTNNAGLPGTSVCVVRVKLDGPVEHPHRLGIGLAGRPMMQDLPGQDAFVRRHVGGSLALHAIMPGRFNATEQGRDNGRGDLVLNCENIVELSIVSLGPDVRLRLAIDELDRSP